MLGLLASRGDARSGVRPRLDRGEDERMLGLGSVSVNFAILTSDVMKGGGLWECGGLRRDMETY